MARRSAGIGSRASTLTAPCGVPSRSALHTTTSRPQNSPFVVTDQTPALSYFGNYSTANKTVDWPWWWRRLAPRSGQVRSCLGRPGQVWVPGPGTLALSVRCGSLHSRRSILATVITSVTGSVPDCKDAHARLPTLTQHTVKDATYTRSRSLPHTDSCSLSAEQQHFHARRAASRTTKKY